MITLHFSKANNSYCNFVIASSESKDELIPFLKDTDTSGDVWCLEGMYYPLICKRVVEEFPEPFKHHFVFNILPDITPEELNVWVECIKNNSVVPLGDITEEHEVLVKSWYNKNLENISFGSEFTPAEIVISPTTFKDRIRWFLGDIQYFYIKLKRKIFN